MSSRHLAGATRTARRSQTSAPHSVLETCTDHMMFSTFGSNLGAAIPIARSIPNRDASDQPSTSSCPGSGLRPPESTPKHSYSTLARSSAAFSSW
jgi:hypothetical protein